MLGEDGEGEGRRRWGGRGKEKMGREREGVDGEGEGRRRWYGIVTSRRE